LASRRRLIKPAQPVATSVVWQHHLLRPAPVHCSCRPRNHFSTPEGCPPPQRKTSVPGAVLHTLGGGKGWRSKRNGSVGGGGQNRLAWPMKYVRISSAPRCLFRLPDRTQPASFYVLVTLPCTTFTAETLLHRGTSYFRLDRRSRTSPPLTWGDRRLQTRRP